MIEDPPFLSHLLFENAWPLVIVLGLAAVVLPLARRRTNSLPVAGVLLAAALGAHLLSRFVVTEREELDAATHRLVEAVRGDSPAAVQALFIDGAVLAAHDGAIWMDSIDTFLKRIESARKAYAPFTHKILDIKTDVPAPNRGRSLLDVNTTVEADTIPVHTQWLLTWRKQSDGSWQIAEVRFMQINRKQASPGMLP